ncbi:YceI family protein [Streptomyces mirabilis]|uniref:YceI family protein n=1 Tax=Streptomyces mirabilis TaxID=68239 RepID=UPI0036604E55
MDRLDPTTASLFAAQRYLLTQGTIRRELSGRSARSSITFTTRHMFGLGRVNGTFALESASISVAESVTESAVHAVVAAGSFHTGAARRDDHVRSPAFLDTDRHPAIRFESSRAVRGDDGVWTVEGSLTVRGHRAPLRLTIDSLALRDGSLRLSLTATAPPTAGPTTNPTAHPTAHPALGTATRAVVPAEEAEEDAVPEAGCRVVAGGVRAGAVVAEGAGVVAPAVAAGEAVGGLRPDATGGAAVSWEPATGVVAAFPVPASRPERRTTIRETSRTVATIASAVPVTSPRLRGRRRAACLVAFMSVRSQERVDGALFSGRRSRKACSRRAPAGLPALTAVP